jgi:predicted ATPase
MAATIEVTSWKAAARESAMRIAVSGSHGTGKSTLIAAFLERRPGYLHEPEAFETLADDIDLTSSEGPTPEGLRALLEFTVAAVALQAPEARVIFERSPADYLAYAAASRGSWPKGSVGTFLAASVPAVRKSLEHLDLIVLLPASAEGPFRPRPGEGAGFRRRVDERLRRALIDDDYGILGGPASPRVVQLSPLPERQLAELIRLSGAGRE